jgi:hypothetical protein
MASFLALGAWITLAQLGVQLAIARFCYRQLQDAIHTIQAPRTGYRHNSKTRSTLIGSTDYELVFLPNRHWARFILKLPPRF